MADYSSTAAPGTGTNGPNMNGTNEANFSAPAPIAPNPDAPKTLWCVCLVSLKFNMH